MARNEVVINVKTKGAKQAKGAFTDLKKGAQALGLAFAGAMVVSFIGDSIGAFSELTESINAVNVVYGEQSDAIHKLGEDSVETFGLSTRKVNEAAVAMQNFATDIDAANPPDAFGNLLQRAADFASVMDIDVDEALENFQSGLAGQSRPLRKFGIDVSAAKVQAFALATGIWDGNGAMTEAEKVQGRYGTIMEQTEKTAGDFAATSDDLANKTRILKEKWEEAQAVMGGALEPAMQNILDLGIRLIPIVEGALAPAFAKLTEELGDAVELFESAARTLGKLRGEVDKDDESTKRWVGSWETLDKKLKPIILDSIPGLVGKAFDLFDATETATGGVEDLTSTQEGWITSSGFAEGAVEDLSSTQRAWIDGSAGPAIKATDDFSVKLEEMAAWLDTNKDAIERNRGALILWNEQMLTAAGRLLAFKQAGGDPNRLADIDAGRVNPGGTGNEAGGGVGFDFGGFSEAQRDGSL